MTDGPHLLAAILAAPADDHVRLVYADCLQELGDEARAEFIRVQCRIAQIQQTCGCGACVKRRGGGQHHNGKCAIDDWQDDGVKLRRREYELWQQHLPTAVDWGLPVPAGPVGWQVTPRPDTRAPAPVAILARGFVAHVTCSAADWIAHADAICAAHPVTRVRLTTCWHPLQSVYGAERYALFHPDVPPGNQPEVLDHNQHAPAARVFRHLKGGARSVPRAKRYGSRAEGMADIKQAFGAEWAGLAFELPPDRHFGRRVVEVELLPAAPAILYGPWPSIVHDDGPCDRCGLVAPLEVHTGLRNQGDMLCVECVRDARMEE